MRIFWRISVKIRCLILNLNKVTFTAKATYVKYKLGDAVHDALEMVAEQMGITA